MMRFFAVIEEEALGIVLVFFCFFFCKVLTDSLGILWLCGDSQRLLEVLRAS